MHSRLPSTYNQFSVPNASINSNTSQSGVYRARALNFPTRSGGGPISIHSPRTGGDVQAIQANLKTYTGGTRVTDNSWIPNKTGSPAWALKPYDAPTRSKGPLDDLLSRSAQTERILACGAGHPTYGYSSDGVRDGGMSARFSYYCPRGTSCDYLRVPTPFTYHLHGESVPSRHLTAPSPHLD